MKMKDVVIKIPPAPPHSLSLKTNEQDLPHQSTQQILTATRKGRGFWTILDLTVINWALWSLTMGLNHKRHGHTGGWSIPGEVTSFFCLTLCLWDWETRRDNWALWDLDPRRSPRARPAVGRRVILFVTLIAVSLSMFTEEPLPILGDWPCGGGDAGQGGPAPASCLLQCALRTRWEEMRWGPKRWSTFPGILSLLGRHLY